MLVDNLDCITATLTSRSSLLLPCDASTRILELLVLLDQHWSFSRLKYPICLLSRTGEEMLTFVRSMMEWLGGTVSKEDVGTDASSKNNKRKRDDGDDDALGALAFRFRYSYFLYSQSLTPGLSMIKASGVLRESSSPAADVFVQGPETNSCSPCIPFSWTIQNAVYGFRVCSWECCTTDAAWRGGNIRSNFVQQVE
jgi:hypothetical protein